MGWRISFSPLVPYAIISRLITDMILWKFSYVHDSNKISLRTLSLVCLSVKSFPPALVMTGEIFTNVKAREGKKRGLMATRRLLSRARLSDSHAVAFLAHVINLL